MFRRGTTSVLSYRQAGSGVRFLKRLMQLGLAVVGIICLGTVATLSDRMPLVATAERAAFDLRLAAAALMEQGPEPRLVIVEIDQRTIDRTLRYSPIDRGFLAELLDRLQHFQPLAIGLDVILDQPSDHSGDAALRQQLSRMHVPTFLAYGGDETDPTAEAAWQARYTRDLVRQSANPYVALASIRFPVDRDGILRDLPKLGERPPAMSRQLARQTGAAATAQGRLKPVLSEHTPTTTAIRADVIIDAPESLATPLALVLKGRLVLVGVNLADSDRHRVVGGVVTGGTVPGVYVHAAALSQFLDDREAAVAGRPIVALIAAFMALAAFAIALQWSRPLGAVAVVTVGLTLYVLVTAVLAATSHGLGPALPVVGPVVSTMLALGAGLAVARQQAVLERRRASDALAHYIPPAVATDLLAAASPRGRHGDKHEITALFTDIADFTGLAESLEPQQLATVLNDYFDGMTKIIHQNAGTLDKYNGDAMVAFWGAPAEDLYQAVHATHCALQLARFADAYAARLRQEGIVFGRTRIGIHKGLAIVGNFGSEERFQYTAIGDTMNIAARLESANKHLGTRILVSASVVESCPDQRFRRVASVIVQGRAQALTVFEPLDDLEGQKDAQNSEAYELMAAGDERCTERFAALASSHPDDELIKFLARRCAAGRFSTTVMLMEK